jgi:hypothetical protein
MPEVTALPAAEGMNINISQGKSVPGTALISITDDITGQTGKYAVNFGTLSYSDPFEPTALNEKWSWVREDPDNWSLTETTGSISVTAQRGDIQVPSIMRKIYYCRVQTLTGQQNPGLCSPKAPGN